MKALLVEDEAALRLATSQTLELGGFAVQACASVATSLRSVSPLRLSSSQGYSVRGACGCRCQRWCKSATSLAG